MPLYLLPALLCLAAPTEAASTREVYDSISLLVSGAPYPSVWWEERAACLGSLSPTLEATMDQAWAGMLDYWTTRGTPSDPWRECPPGGNHTRVGWFENNCTRQAPVEMDIWEPCNYASNLAYDRLVVEMCLQHQWTLSANAVTKIAEAFNIVTFGSAFFHGSQTKTGESQDILSIEIFCYILYQAGVSNLPYDPIIHDLSYEPRPQTGQSAVDTILDAYDNSPVEDWYDIQANIQIPPLKLTFGGIFGYILTLLFDPDTVDQIVAPLLELFGVSEEDREFMTTAFLPAIRAASSHHFLGLRDRLELLTNTLATVTKLFFAFFWQEEIDFGGVNLTPETNQLGADFLPYLNEMANNRTSWALHVGDVQRGEGYPGWQSCNPLIPHAKWHVETAASLSDVVLLMDSVLRMVQSSQEEHV